MWAFVTLVAALLLGAASSTHVLLARSRQTVYAPPPPNCTADTVEWTFLSKALKIRGVASTQYSSTVITPINKTDTEDLMPQPNVAPGNPTWTFGGDDVANDEQLEVDADDVYEDEEAEEARPTTAQPTDRLLGSFPYVSNPVSHSDDPRGLTFEVLAGGDLVANCNGTTAWYTIQVPVVAVWTELPELCGTADLVCRPPKGSEADVSEIVWMRYNKRHSNGTSLIITTVTPKHQGLYAAHAVTARGTVPLCLIMVDVSAASKVKYRPAATCSVFDDDVLGLQAEPAPSCASTEWYRTVDTKSVRLARTSALSRVDVLTLTDPIGGNYTARAVFRDHSSMLLGNYSITRQYYPSNVTMAKIITVVQPGEYTLKPEWQPHTAYLKLAKGPGACQVGANPFVQQAVLWTYQTSLNPRADAVHLDPSTYNEDHSLTIRSGNFGGFFKCYHVVGDTARLLAFYKVNVVAGFGEYTPMTAYVGGTVMMRTQVYDIAGGKVIWRRYYDDGRVRVVDHLFEDKSSLMLGEVSIEASGKYQAIYQYNGGEIPLSSYLLQVRTKRGPLPMSMGSKLLPTRCLVMCSAGDMYVASSEGEQELQRGLERLSLRHGKNDLQVWECTYTDAYGNDRTIQTRGCVVPGAYIVLFAFLITVLVSAIVVSICAWRKDMLRAFDISHTLKEAGRAFRECRIRARAYNTVPQ